MMERTANSPAKSMKVSTTQKDQISHLPYDIIHEILSRLTMLDVERISLTSKALARACASFPFLIIDQQDFSHIPCDVFKNILCRKVRYFSIQEECLDILKFKLCMNDIYAQEAKEEIEECIRLVSKTSNVKEFDFQFMYTPNRRFNDDWRKIFHSICRMRTLTVLRFSGLTTVIQPYRDVQFSHLEILSIEDVTVKDGDIGWLSTSCPFLREIRLVKCYGLVNLKVCGDKLGHLNQLEVGFCPQLVSVKIQVPSLQKFVLSEIRRRRLDTFCLALSIDKQTCQNLRELTLCNSTLPGKTFGHIFSECSNVEFLELVRCVHFFKITIASQKLRTLVMRKCFDVLVTDIKATNLTSFIFCNYLSRGKFDEDLCSKYMDPTMQYCEEISQKQECLLDLNPLLWTKTIWISLWFDKFKDTAGQKMVIYPKQHCHHVVVLEDWGSMLDFALMTRISELPGSRMTITTMSFTQLVDYVFGDYFKGFEKVLAISFTDTSRLYQIMKRNPKLSCEQCYSGVITESQVDAFSFGTCWPWFSNIAATLKATSFSIIPTQMLKSIVQI